MNNPERDKRKESRMLKDTLLSFLFCVVGVVFSTLCIAQAQSSFFVRYKTLCFVVATVFLGVYYLFSLVAIVYEKESFFRLMISGYFLLLFCLILLYILQRTGFLYVIKSREKLQEYLQKSGKWMPIVYTVLQFLQVVLLPIPGFVSTAVGVALFGPFASMLYSVMGVVLGSLLAFYIGRKFGYKAAKWIVGEEDLNKWMNRVKGKDYLILTIMFILPLFPDDVLCFVAGLSSMSSIYFLTVVVLSRIIGIAATCYSVNLIPFNTWWGILIWFCIVALVVGLFIYLYKHIDKLNDYLKRKGRKKGD